MKRQAYTILKHLLVTRPVAPGTFLSERQLSKQLGMSNTPVRAALERLEAEGFVAISPQQGIVIRELSIPEIADLYELREALEPFVVRRLTGNLTDEQIRRLYLNLDDQRESLEVSDVHRNI